MLFEAIKNLHPNATYMKENDGALTVQDSDYNLIAIDEQAVQAEVTRLQAEYAAKQYQRDRAAAYPSLAAQMDMRYWDEINGTTTWADAIAAVKAQYPKPEGV